NIVSTVNLACPLDLKSIALQARNAEYNPKHFAAVIMRISEPRTTALIFSSGKMVCTGPKRACIIMACSLSGEPRALGPGEEHPESGSEALVSVRPQPPQQHLPPACVSAAAAVMVEALDDAEGLFVAVERCPLCNTARRRLTCARCIQNGDFVFFDGRNPERVINAMDKKVQADQLRWKIMSCKMKIQQLKEAICTGNEEVKSGRELLLRSQDEEQRLQRRASRHQEKRDKIKRHNQRLGELLEKRSKELQGRLEVLAEVRREHILELTTHIFNVQEEKQGSRDPAEAENDLALTSSTVSELAEARRITYSSGRWIWDDQNGETSISITGPHVTLPSNGDCSAYYSWVEEKSGNQGPELDHINPAHTISAALCYATQLVNILSHILDVSLPKKLCNSEFCGDNLTRYRFTRAVNKLNTNILHLCFSQQTRNLAEPGVSADFGDSHGVCGTEGMAAESGDEAVTDEETDLGTDWETVPSPRFCDIPSQPMDLSQSGMQASQPVGNAGGMISSAAASVTSWFRAYTGQR
ncbi:hypothetical protein cypCar_00008358, partial [Cyprinus carpio]